MLRENHRIWMVLKKISVCLSSLYWEKSRSHSRWKSLIHEWPLGVVKHSNDWPSSFSILATIRLRGSMYLRSCLSLSRYACSSALVVWLDCGLGAGPIELGFPTIKHQSVLQADSVRRIIPVLAPRAETNSLIVLHSVVSCYLVYWELH